MKQRISNLVILAVLFASFPLKAQHTATNDSVSLNRVLTLEREYNPSIREASKINQLPEIKEPEAPKTQIDFANYSVPFEVNPQLSLLKANAYFTDLATSRKRGYLSAGVSSFVDINGDLGYQLLNTDKDQLSLFGSHRSSNGNVTYLQDDKKQKMKINDNLLGLDFMHNFGKIRLNADFQYTYSAFNYYGWTMPDYSSVSTPQEPNVDKNTNQVNNIFDFNAGISSDEENELAYMLKLGYSSFQPKHSIAEIFDVPKENRFKADWDVHKGFNTDMAIGFGGYLKNYSSSKLDLPERMQAISGFGNYTNILLNPYFKMEGNNWDLRLGAKVNVISGDSSSVNFAPDVNFTYRPLEKMALYIRMDGGVTDNGLYSMFYENRYVLPLERVKDSRTSFDATAGVKSAVSGNWWFDIFAGYKYTKDEHFFIPMAPYDMMVPENFIAGNVSSAIYMDAGVFKLGGNLKYTYQDLFEIGIKATYYKWDLPSNTYMNYQGYPLQPEAWNKPSFVSDVTLGFKVPELPLRLDAIYRLEAGRKALFEETVDMKNINELKVKGTYTINDTFSIFAQVNNLLFQKYDLWYGYPAENFSIMGGINIRF